MIGIYKQQNPCCIGHEHEYLVEKGDSVVSLLSPTPSPRETFIHTSIHIYLETSADMARIGPNPYITEVARHVPRVGAWAGVMVLFFGWPMVGKYTQRAGVWNP